MSRIPSYASIFALGHKAVRELLLDPVVVQEKVDGSQISFSLQPVLIDPDTGRTETALYVRSKGAELYIEAPDKMFAKAVEQIKQRESLLRPGWVYRGEYLAKPKHNALAYDRVPIGNIVLFDVDQGGENYLSPSELAAEALRIGLEVVPLLHYGMVETEQKFRELLDSKSFLGGQKVEGVVIKNYARFGPDKKALMAKFVSEAFKEVHGAEWKNANPGRQDILQYMIERLKTPARYQKAVQHLREAGQITDSPRDIGLLFREVPADIAREEQDFIKQKLFEYFWPMISRGCTAGLAEWYKDQLVKQQFENTVLESPAPDTNPMRLENITA